MSKKSIISISIGVAFSVATLFLAFRNIPISDLVHYLSKINYFWLIPAIAVGLLSFLLRIVRWQMIINAGAENVSFKTVYHTLMIGFMLNCILPLRVGEIARPMILKTREQIPFSKGLATIAAERIFDLMTLLILFTVLLSSIEIDPELVITFGNYKISADVLTGVFDGMMKLSIILLAGIILVNLTFFRNIIIKLILRLPDILFFLSDSGKEKVYKKIALPLTDIAESFTRGFRLMKHPGKLALCMVYSFAIWGIQAASYHIMSFGCPGVELGFTEMTTVMIIICFSIALPSVPGYWGLWEAGGIFALAVFSVARENAAGYTLVNHVVQVVPVIIAGGVSALIIGININQIYQKR